MAKVTYNPNEDQIAEGGLPKDTTQFGYDFTAGKAVEVNNPAQLRKFAGHPFFTVSGSVPDDNTVRTAAERESALLGAGSQAVVTGAAPAGPVVAPVPDQPQRGPDKVTPGQADAPDGDSGLRAVHRGRGVYAVMEGDKDEEVLGGLTKADAEAFNALNADDKLAYVATAPQE
jgi:hypothetical protein